MQPSDSSKNRLAVLLILVIFIFIIISYISLKVVYGDDQKNLSLKTKNYELNDSHLHLTNYIQKGTDIKKMIQIMGDKVGRAALFGIPLQQQWDYHISGNKAPAYYLESDAPLYYYSFTDAQIAMAYKSLSPGDQQRFDPMITGFNPSDMYAVDHIKRVLLTFPGVFSGIGEFSIHKEFVSSKVAGGPASLTDPALDSILDFAGEAGLAVILHNDIDVPFAKDGNTPAYLDEMKDLLKRHPRTTIIWAHLGLGRVIHPVRSGTPSEKADKSENQIEIVKGLIRDPEFKHLYFDISWTEVAKYIIRNDTTIKATADIINQYPDRFLFGTDVVAPTDQIMYLEIYKQYEPLLEKLTPEAKRKLLKDNYQKIFDEARVRVRMWEKKNTNTLTTLNK